MNTRRERAENGNHGVSLGDFCHCLIDKITEFTKCVNTKETTL